MPGAGVPEMLVQLALDHEITRLTAQMDVYHDQEGMFGSGFGLGSKRAQTVQRQLRRLEEVVITHPLDLLRTPPSLIDYLMTLIINYLTCDRCLCDYERTLTHCPDETFAGRGTVGLVPIHPHSQLQQRRYVD